MLFKHKYSAVSMPVISGRTGVGICLKSISGILKSGKKRYLFIKNRYPVF